MYDELKSEWNSAEAYLMRIDKLLQACNFYKTSRQFDSWLLNICAFHDEISPRMKVHSIKGEVKLDEFATADKFKADAIMKVNLWKRGVNMDLWILFDALSKYERFLRDIMRQRGMDLPSKSDPSHALLNQN